MNKCRGAFAACKGYEDATIKYIASCKTGATSLKSTLSSLYAAQDMISKVKNKTDTVATKGNSSTSSSRQLSSITSITYTTITVNTSDTASFTSPSEFINAMAMFTDVSQKLSVDSIGSDSRIRLRTFLYFDIYCASC